MLQDSTANCGQVSTGSDSPFNSFLKRLLTTTVNLVLLRVSRNGRYYAEAYGMLSVNQILCHIKRGCVVTLGKTDSVASNDVGCFVLPSVHFDSTTLIRPMYVV